MSNKRPGRFHSVDNLLHKVDAKLSEDLPSSVRCSSPLDFLAQASVVVNEETDGVNCKWQVIIGDNHEKITVVPGPSGVSIRLHKGSGRLPPIDLSKPFAKKCRNRECSNLGGQIGKPRSIYCSKRCQSREQNLRQGRIKNVRSPTSATPPNPMARTDSPSPTSSPSPTNLPSSVSMLSDHSPLTIGVGMSPSPIFMNPATIRSMSAPPSSARSSPFSPIPMSSAIQNSADVSTPVFLPRPQALQPLPKAPSTSFSTATFSSPSSSFSPSSSPLTPSTTTPTSKTFSSESLDSLTLAPILSSN